MDICWRVSRDLQEQNWEVERIYGEVRMFGEVTEQSEVLRRGGQDVGLYYRVAALGRVRPAAREAFKQKCGRITWLRLLLRGWIIRVRVETLGLPAATTEQLGILGNHKEGKPAFMLIRSRSGCSNSINKQTHIRGMDWGCGLVDRVLA